MGTAKEKREGEMEIENWMRMTLRAATCEVAKNNFKTKR